VAYYNWNTNEGLGPAEIRDGDGNRIRHVIKLDTETGDCLHCEESHPGVMSEVRKQLKLPVTVKFLTP
jgi:hypothetical protein